MKSLLAAAAMLTATGCVSVSGTRTVTGPPCRIGSSMVETQLFLGMAMPNNGAVTEQQFADFVEKEVVPRWKEGFTVLSGQGLWYSETRKLTEREPSRVLVRFHDGGAGASGDIEAIRAAYKKAFTQDAVLRTDRSTCADF
jgi:hypothetical protein